MALASIKDLLVHELRDLLSAEKQQVRSLSKLIKAATNEALVDALTDHLEETKVHVTRIEECLGILEVGIRGKKCAGIEGIMTEVTELVAVIEDDDVCDAAIISGAQRAEHYEISAYGTARAFALRIGEEDVAELLSETLSEELDADELLSQIAEGQVNIAAQESVPAAPSDLIPTKGGNGHQAKQPNGKDANVGLQPSKTPFGRPVSDRKWRRGLGAH